MRYKVEVFSKSELFEDQIDHQAGFYFRFYADHEISEEEARKIAEKKISDNIVVKVYHLKAWD